MSMIVAEFRDSVWTSKRLSLVTLIFCGGNDFAGKWLP